MDHLYEMEIEAAITNNMAPKDEDKSSKNQSKQ